MLRRFSASLGSQTVRRFSLAIFGLALFCAGVLLYLRAVGYGFIAYDDEIIVLEHPTLYNGPTLWDSLGEIFVRHFPREEPLLIRDVSWLLDAHVFGFANPVGYHLGNVLLNAADGVLVFLLLLHATRSALLAVVSAVLFAGLAVHVEPVCWVMGRKDLLGAFFVLLAMLVQSIQLRHESRRLRRLLAVIVFVLYPLAVLSKFSAIVLVAVLAAQRIFAPYLDGRRAPGQPFLWREWPRRFLGLLPHAVVGCLLYLWYQRNLTEYGVVGDNGPPPFSLTHLGNLAVLIPMSIAASLARILRATGHSVFYLTPSVEIQWTSGEVALAIAVVVGIAALVVVLGRYRKDLAFFPITFLIFLFPYWNIVYVGIWASDRYSYLASLCVVTLLAAPVVHGWRSPQGNVRRASLAGLALLTAFLGYQLAGGWTHHAAFHDRDSIWSYEMSLPRPSMLAQASYASRLLRRAVEAEPGSALRRSLLESAVAAAKAGAAYQASIPWRNAPQYQPRERRRLAELFTVLGSAAELSGGPLEQQLELFRAAVRILPGPVETRDLARCLLTMAMREPRNASLARESLARYRQHVRGLRRDARKPSLIERDLRIYASDFPELAGDVRAIEAESLR